MAVHDFWCQGCGLVFIDVNIPVTIGATAGAPTHCGKPTSWLPAVGRMDAYEPFREFVTRDGQNREVLVDSLRKLRTLERESEQMARNGEGQPLVWRHYANDRSNRDSHTLAPPNWTGGERPDPAWVKKHGAEMKRDESVAETEYGPGVSDATPSALDHLSRG